MSCLFPLMIKPSAEREPVYVPCGRCRGCRLDLAKAWALRCVHEAQMHAENCFVTLTYDDDHLPSDGSVHKDVLQRFLKRLRKAISPVLIRFFGCGEYGQKLLRPHYHILIFGYAFKDLEVNYVNRITTRSAVSGVSDYAVCTSPSLRRLWPYGFHTIGEVTPSSAGYVARYVRKKIGGPPAREHYKGLEPEFALMSRKPGLGCTWFDEYWRDVYPKDFTTVQGKKYKAPRFYDRLLMRRDYHMYELVRSARKANVRYEDPNRRRSKERYLIGVTRTLERSYEHVK